MSGLAGRLWPRIAVAITGVLAWSWLAAAPVDIVRECALKISPANSGIKALKATCPQLEDALQTLGLTPMLYDGWQERLNQDQLKDLAALAATYSGTTQGRPPDVAVLPGILKALAVEQSPAKSWWDALRAWLRGWLAHHPDALTWLDRWLDRIGQSATLLHVISYSLVALVLIAAAAVIVNEIRAAGASRRGRDPASAASDVNQSALCAESVDLEPLSLADKLTVLLRHLVNRLMQTRRLNAERSLTHRELLARSAFDDESQRAVFAAVASAAESIVYGSHAPLPEQLNRVLSEGRVLLAQIADLPSAH